MTNKLLEELKQVVQPYRFSWSEWSNDNNCNLNNDEINLINIYLESSFEISVLESVLFYRRTKAIKEVIRKLTLGYQIFKDFVIVNFLFNIISMAKRHGYKKFLETPVHELEIPETLKEILKSFKAYTLQQLFIIYNVEDFSRARIFRQIAEFQVYVKESSLANASSVGQRL